MNNNLIISGKEIKCGEKTIVEIPLPKICGSAEVNMPVTIYRSHKPGPRLFISGCIHGDEIIGIEIIKRLILSSVLRKLLCGDVIVVPIVNMYGFINQSRYLPDRKDLNRLFPGSEHGSLGSRVADIFLKEIVYNCTHGIDLHSGAADHFNLPQIRIDMKDEESYNMAEAFNAPLIVRSSVIEGSLRKICEEKQIPTILFEGSEANRFEDKAAEVGFQGIINVLAYLGMTSASNCQKHQKSYTSKQSSWERAPESGIFQTTLDTGMKVTIGQVLGEISDLFGNLLCKVESSYEGIIIGITRIHVINSGDALFHIATLES